MLCLGRGIDKQLHLLYEALEVPDMFTSPIRVTWTGLESVLVLLSHLAYPARLGDLCEEFGRSKGVLSVIFSTMLIS